jgi:hypothetical protein
MLVVMQYMDICNMLQEVEFLTETPDSLQWRWSSSGSYSSSLAYAAMFLGEISIQGTKELWKVKAANECKLFA